MMEFKFAADASFNFLKAFSEAFKAPVYKNRVSVPAAMGVGSIKMIEIEPLFKLVIHHYTLKQAFHLKRLALETPSGMLSFVFNSNELPTESPVDRQEARLFFKNNESAVQISSSFFGTETFFREKSEVRFVVIGIDASLLASLLQVEKRNQQVYGMLHGHHPFFYHLPLSVDERRIIEQLAQRNEQDGLDHLYYRIQAQQLLYLIFRRLLAKENRAMKALNRADIDKLYEVRTAILTNIAEPPRLKELSKMGGMSETKMKQLFKQVFGDTIYNYYQQKRMDEAAYLIKHGGYSVSEAGYHLGFSNLSHFARLFKKHHGATPKKYVAAG